MKIIKSAQLNERDFLDQRIKKLESSLYEDVQRAQNVLEQINRYRQNGQFDIAFDQVLQGFQYELESLRYDINVIREG